MRTEHMEEFVVLASELNFTSAAKKLYITQPALSRHITALERELGASLIDRSTHDITLTSAGKCAADRFRKIVDDYRNACTDITMLDSRHECEIRIGFLLSSLDEHLYSALEKAAEQSGRCRISPFFKDADELIFRLTHEAIDACLLLDVMFPGRDSMDFIPVASLSKAILVHCSDKLARKDEVALEDIACRTLVFVANEGDNASALLALCEKRGLPRPSTVQCSQKSTQLLTMRKVNGIAVTTLLLHKSLPASMRLIPLAEPELNSTIGWMHRRNDFGSEHRTALEIVTASLREHGAL